ncbi:MAG: hypothetical protein GY765_04340 [bacterium]|nr:hypothetical protein [bacterium]
MKYKISLLTTSVYFHLERVFILNHCGKYRLIVYHQRELLADNSYNSVSCAKTAFIKGYGYKLDDSVRAALKVQCRQPVRWTHFYDLDSDGWLEGVNGLDRDESGSSGNRSERLSEKAG